ncbi:MAG: hypothetical protein ACI9E1_000627 [Cryomorphaceae bacterium]|jgi:hypothetical protein
MNTDPSKPELSSHEALPESWLVALRTYPTERVQLSPKSVDATLAMAEEKFAVMRRSRRRPLLWSSLAAAACLLFSLLLFLQPKSHSDDETATTAPKNNYAVILREVSAVFPQQVKAIVSNGDSLEITLTDQPLTDTKQAVVIELLNKNDVTAVITYIGQTIEIGQRRITVRPGKNGKLLIDAVDLQGTSESPLRIAPNTRIKTRTI